MLQAMAEAISDAEKEAATATEDQHHGSRGEQDAALEGATQESREADARRQANIFLQSMERGRRNQPEAGTGGGVGDILGGQARSR